MTAAAAAGKGGLSLSKVTNENGSSSLSEVNSKLKGRRGKLASSEYIRGLPRVHSPSPTPVGRELCHQEAGLSAPLNWC